MKIKQPNTVDRSLNSLSISHANMGYGRKTIIHNVSTPAIPAGSLVAVIGSNAAGKSTLLKSLAGQLAYQGKIFFQNNDIASMTHDQRMSVIGYLPQALPQATTLIAYELVFSACKSVCHGLSREDIEMRIEQVFEQLDIRHLALMKMSEMSGGQRQMIGLAQILVRRSRLLLLDEPTSALDLHWQLNVLQSIKEETVQRQATAFIASHDLNLSLRFCDQLLILAKGKVLAIGKPQEVLSTDYLRQAYGIDGRIESCSKGFPIVLVDKACA